MSTRSCIARIKGDGFAGVYHHWDGYPAGLGAELYQLAHNRTLGDLPAMLKTLIDDQRRGLVTSGGLQGKRIRQRHRPRVLLPRRALRRGEPDHT